jgi:hypothetical protein
MVLVPLASLARIHFGQKDTDEGFSPSGSAGEKFRTLCETP